MRIRVRAACTAAALAAFSGAASAQTLPFSGYVQTVPLGGTAGNALSDKIVDTLARYGRARVVPADEQLPDRLRSDQGEFVQRGVRLTGGRGKQANQVVAPTHYRRLVEQLRTVFEVPIQAAGRFA